MDEIVDVNTNSAEEKNNKKGKGELSFATLRFNFSELCKTRIFWLCHILVKMSCQSYHIYLFISSQ